MVLAAVSLSSAAQQEYKVDVSRIVHDFTGEVTQDELESERQHCSAFADKYNLELAFFYINDASVGLDSLDGYLDILYRNNDLNLKGSNYSGGLYVVINLANYSFSYLYTHGLGQYVKDNSRHFLRLIEFWHISCWASKFVDMLECFKESRPLFPMGISWDEAFSQATAYGDGVYDISGLLGGSYHEDISQHLHEKNTNYRRNVELAMVFAPSFNAGNMRTIARQIASAPVSSGSTIVFINQYDYSFIIHSDNTDRNLSEADEAHLSGILAQDSTLFLSASTVNSFLDYYMEHSTISGEMTQDAEDAMIGSTICCSLPVALCIAIAVMQALRNSHTKNSNTPQTTRYVQDGSLRRL